MLPFWSSSPLLTKPPLKIGNTPRLTLSLQSGDLTHFLVLKLEGFNAFGSIKDRVAWGMLVEAIRTGRVREGSRIVEASSGNTGAALAGIGRMLNLEVTIVSNRSITDENRKAIEESGASLLISEAPVGQSDHAARIDLARRISVAKAALFVNQYENDANPMTHRSWTAPESLEDLACDAIFVAASSGGTAAGFAAYLGTLADTSLIIVDPHGSCVFEQRSMPGELSIPGYGSSKKSSFQPVFSSASSICISDLDAIAMAVEMSAFDICVGLSSGGVISGAIHWLMNRTVPSTALCICADHASKYSEHELCSMTADQSEAFEALRIDHRQKLEKHLVRRVATRPT